MHSNELPLSDAAKPKLADALVVGSGGADVMVVSGAVVSTVMVRRAGCDGLPATSRATAAMACAPSASPVRFADHPQELPAVREAEAIPA